MAALFQLVENRLAPQPGQLILKAEDAATLIEAGKLLAEIRAHADETGRKAEENYRQRHEAGYQDGLHAGKMEYAGKIMETVMSSVEYLENLEVSLVKIVSEIVRKLIGEMDHGELIVRLVRQALQTVRGERKVIIRISSRDEAAVRQGLGGLLQQHGDAERGFLDLLSDPDLPPGSCILESEMGVVEASLETQLKNLESVLRSRIQNAG
ncbi:type III secretion system protein [Betaproteobacteria bacterium]|nr:type III secretion system protein [Betaproteobacteria bacterium]GHT98322.1 type III secretion system protein [Betaproteobacteria bacterium]GHU00988.1 type III secretion system protein [Betaproteobacteria bacterium]GHU09676.1 type III secretion system protein [Betaproteobacteria bacterium]GHU21852.1 type III secretion system protein [Betaproteobacteria bacterium]